jgi:hypothetical protein
MLQAKDVPVLFKHQAMKNYTGQDAQLHECKPRHWVNVILSLKPQAIEPG